MRSARGTEFEVGKDRQVQDKKTGFESFEVRVTVTQLETQPSLLKTLVNYIQAAIRVETFRMFPYENTSFVPFEVAARRLVAVKIRNAAVQAAIRKMYVTVMFFFWWESVSCRYRSQIRMTIRIWAPNPYPR